MSRRTSTVTLLACVFLSTIIDHIADAQLVECAVGNTSLAAVGVAGLNTTISPQPLTWTIGIQQKSGQPDSQVSLDRDFFLGTPPALQLSASTSFIGCALFFDGVEAKLAFRPSNEEDPRTQVGTCSDVLTSNCVTDLVSSARAQLPSLVGATSGNESATCAALGAAVADHAPSSCTIAQKGAWGTLLSRPLTGPNAAPKIQNQSNCHPTTGKDYDLSLVASYRRISHLSLPEMQPTLLGITPVMTVFYTDPSVEKGPGALKDAELQLTCLKVVDDNKGSTPPTSGATATWRRESAGFIALLTALASIMNIF